MKVIVLLLALVSPVVSFVVQQPRVGGGLVVPSTTPQSLVVKDNTAESSTSTQLFSSLAYSGYRTRYDYDYDYPRTSRYGNRLARDSYYRGYNDWDTNNRYTSRWNDNSYYSGYGGGYNTYNNNYYNRYPLTGSTGSYIMSDNYYRNNDYSGYGYGGNSYYPSSYYNNNNRYGYGYYNNVNDQSVNDRYYYPSHNTYRRRNDGTDRWWNYNSYY
jgi:hypothetical protein